MSRAHRQEIPAQGALIINELRRRLLNYSALGSKAPQRIKGAWSMVTDSEPIETFGDPL
jgi:hypothetical protein